MSFFSHGLLVSSGKTVGPDVWDKKSMAKHTLRMAKSPHEPTKPMFPPSTEAFCFIIFDNNAAKWAANIELYKSTNFSQHLPARKPKPKGQTRDPDPHHDAKYTDVDGGQQQYGTFSEEGLSTFNEMRLAIQGDRQKNGKKHYDLEKLFLETHLQLPGRRGKEGGKKRKSAGDGPGDSTQNKVIVILLDDSDDEFDPNAAPAAATTAAGAASRPTAAAARSAAATARSAAATARRGRSGGDQALVGPPRFTGQPKDDGTHLDGEDLYGSPV